MAEVAVLNSKFQNSGSLDVGELLSKENINTPVVHQVVKAILASRRQGTASTKTKAMVRGGGKKPFKQKGTGNARQGSSRSPLMPGGGVAFGPHPRSYEQKVNKKVADVAVKSILADKFQAGKLHVVDVVESDGKTKNMFKVLQSKNMLPALIVTSSRESLALRAVKNIATAKGLAVEGFSVYEAVKYENLVIEKGALEALLKRVGEV